MKPKTLILTTLFLAIRTLNAQTANHTPAPQPPTTIIPYQTAEIRFPITAPRTQTPAIDNPKARFPYTEPRKILYTSLPLIIEGLIAKSQDAHFRQLRNDYLPQFKHHADDYLQYAPAAALLTLKLAGADAKSTTRQMITADAIATTLVCGTVTALKHCTQAVRPDGSNKHSFPSGHTATAFLTAGLLTKEYGHLNPLIGIGAYTTATATGLMRMANNKHWLSDVLCGAGIGILSAEIAYWLTGHLFPHEGNADLQPANALSADDKPHFIGLYLGMNIPISVYDIDEQNTYRTSSGSRFGIEGAWFANHRFGIGTRLIATNTAIITNEKRAEPNTLRTNSIQIGAYLSLPLTKHILTGLKLTVGCQYYHPITLETTTIPSKTSLAFGSGISLTLRTRNRYAVRLFAEHDLQPPHSRNSAEYLHYLSCGTAFCITL